MRVPIFRAKDKDSNEIVEGFYFEYPLVNSVTSGSINSNLCHSLITYKPGVMGLINEPTGCTIDLSTMEFVKFIDIPCSNENIIL